MSEKKLIIHVDDIGVNPGASKAGRDLLSSGCATSGSLMMICPEAVEFCNWAKDKDFDIGVHSTVTCEWDEFRWTGLTKEKNSFTYNDLTMIKGSNDEIMSVEVEDYVKEVKAQIELATAQGLKISHLDNHMWTARKDKEMLKAYIDLSQEYNIAVNIPTWIRGIDEYNELLKNYNLIEVSSNVSINHKENKTYEDKKKDLINILENLNDGINILTVHAQAPDEKGDKMVVNVEDRHCEYLLLQDEDIKDAIKNLNIKLIGWRDCIK